MLLATTEVTNRSYYGAVPLNENEVTQIATADVRAFLHGYLPPRAGEPLERVADQCCSATALSCSSASLISSRSKRVGS